MMPKINFMLEYLVSVDMDSSLKFSWYIPVETWVFRCLECVEKRLLTTYFFAQDFFTTEVVNLQCVYILFLSLSCLES